MRNLVRNCFHFVIGIVNPVWMPAAPKDQTVRETVELAWAVHTWRPRVRMVASGVTWLLAIYGLYSFFM